MAEPIKAIDVQIIMAKKQLESLEYIEPFKEKCVEYINNTISENDWGIRCSPTAEISHSLWHDNFPKLLQKDAFSVYASIISLYEKAGWHVFSSTGAQKMFYFTLTPEHIWVQQQKERK